MSALDQAIDAIQQVIDSIESAEKDAATAHSQAGEALDAAQTLGAETAIAGTSAVQEACENLMSQLASLREAAGGVLSQAQAVKSGG